MFPQLSISDYTWQSFFLQLGTAISIVEFKMFILGSLNLIAVTAYPMLTQVFITKQQRSAGTRLVLSPAPPGWTPPVISPHRSATLDKPSRNVYTAKQISNLHFSFFLFFLVFTHFGRKWVSLEKKGGIFSTCEMRSHTNSSLRCVNISLLLLHLAFSLPDYLSLGTHLFDARKSSWFGGQSDCLPSRNCVLFSVCKSSKRDGPRLFVHLSVSLKYAVDTCFIILRSPPSRKPVNWRHFGLQMRKEEERRMLILNEFVG